MAVNVAKWFSVEPKMPKQRAPRERARVISVFNQKGGVGKTTSTISIGASLAEAGYRVLVVDFDPQGSLTVGLTATDKNGGKVGMVVAARLGDRWAAGFAWSHERASGADEVEFKIDVRF